LTFQREEVFSEAAAVVLAQIVEKRTACLRRDAPPDTTDFPGE